MPSDWLWRLEAQWDPPAPPAPWGPSRGTIGPGPRVGQKLPSLGSTAASLLSSSEVLTSMNSLRFRKLGTRCLSAGPGHSRVASWHLAAAPRPHPTPANTILALGHFQDMRLQAGVTMQGRHLGAQGQRPSPSNPSHRDVLGTAAQAWGWKWAQLLPHTHSHTASVQGGS